MRLVGYVRVSTEDQAANGVSLDAQRSRITAYCTAHDAELVAIEADEGISGKVPPHRRPGLARALERVRSADTDGLVVLKLDRLSRSTRDVLDLSDECQRRGWYLISVSEHLDTSTAAGRLVVTVLAALSQMEREQIGERTREAMAYLAREGRRRSRHAPFGWRVIGGKKLERVREEGKILERMLQMRADGFGARRVASHLGVNPRTGRSWNRGTVASILATHDRLREVQGD